MNAVSELSTLIHDYLASHSNLSTNAIARYSGVAETTLRRIKNGDLKRLPSNDNILKILFYLYKSRDLGEISEKVPEALGEHLKKEYQQVLTSQQEVSFLDESIIQNEVDYLILILASNTSGVHKDEITRQFGLLGHSQANTLIEKEIIKREGDYYKSCIQSFRVSDSLFVKNFKAMANYIKVDREKREHSNLYYNLSESLNVDAYQKVRSIQIEASKQIIEILNDSRNHGDIPMFNLIAVDTVM